MPEDFLRTYFINQDNGLYRARFRALLSCLDIRELIKVAEYATFHISANSEESLALNSYLLTRINEIPHATIKSYLHRLITHYQNSQTHRTQYSFVMIIRELIPRLDNKSLAADCCHLFLRSTYRSIRGNGYKMLSYLEDEEHDLIDKLFFTFHDQVAYQIIVSSDYVDLKEKYFDELFSRASEYELWQLYKDIDINPERLKLLRGRDVITYVYVCAMRGISLSEQEASEIWNSHKDDDRKYILISSFGKLKLWDLLTEIV